MKGTDSMDKNDSRTQGATAPDQLETENAELRKLFRDFWKWADPPFALKSGSFEEFMGIAERAQAMGLLK